MTRAIYRISNTEGRTGRSWDATYYDLTSAHEALQSAMGLGSIFLSTSFCADGATDERGETYARCAYLTREAMLADEEGADAPRVYWSVQAEAVRS